MSSPTESSFWDRHSFDVHADTARPTANGLFAEADVDFYLGQKQRRRGSGGRVWTNLYYGDTVLKPKDLDYKIKPDLYGVQFGFDVVKSHGVYATFFGNYNRSETNIGNDARSRIENYFFGLGKYVFLKGCHFGYNVGLGYDHYQVSDFLADEKPKGDGLQLNLFGEFGVDLVFGRWALKPFYALQYDYLYHGRIGDFQGDWDGHSLIQLIGTRVNWRVFESMELQGRLTWVHEMLKHPPPFYNIRFSPIEGAPAIPAIYHFEGDAGRDWAWVGLSVKLEAVYNIILYLDYDLTINERHTTHFGNIGLCLKW